jgi:hypothetical protein
LILEFKTTCLLLFENGFPNLVQNQIQNISYNSKQHAFFFSKSKPKSKPDPRHLPEFKTTCLLFFKMDFQTLTKTRSKTSSRIQNDMPSSK